ncbi:hypothetical protein ONZ45_g5440 [Pleurotus djamor]|nr:hypothetical protein ONZ45_g5440 [Pleurotus djamor]
MLSFQQQQQQQQQQLDDGQLPPHMHNAHQQANPPNATATPPQPHDPQNQQPTMRLKDDPAPINPTTTRNSRKRKSPPNQNTTGPSPPQPPQQQQQQQPSPQQPSSMQPQPQVIHVLPPPHVMMHPQLQGLPQFAQYAAADYTPGGLPTQPIQAPQGDQPPPQSPPGANGNRALSNSKRAEQNRKAQRAFRERRDQHVKALESRSQLLDAALASADEANRRWEECRALVDQLRVENAALRAALSQAHLLPPGVNAPATLATAPASSQAPGLSTTISQEDAAKEGADAGLKGDQPDSQRSVDSKKDG